MAVDRNDGCIDHGIFHVRIIRDGFEDPFEHAFSRPVIEAFEDRIPIAEFGRQIPPGAAGARFPQNRFDKKPIVASAAARIGALPWQCGAIFAHWESVKTVRSIIKLLKRSLNHDIAVQKTLNLNKP